MYIYEQRIIKCIESSKVKGLKLKLVLSRLLELQLIGIHLLVLDVALAFYQRWQVLYSLIKTLIDLAASLIPLQRLPLQLTYTANIVHQSFPLPRLLLLLLIALR